MVFFTLFEASSKYITASRTQIHVSAREEMCDASGERFPKVVINGNITSFNIAVKGATTAVAVVM